MAIQRNNQYWQDRQRAAQDAILARGEVFEAEMAKRYRQAQAAAIDQIETFYGRFARENEITWQEARRILTNSERKAFQLTLQSYIEKGQTLNVSSQWAAQLENASTVYRISRLESLVMGIQNEIEQLAARYDNGMLETAADILQNGYLRQTYELQKGIGAGLKFDVPGRDWAETIASKPWAGDGRTFSQRIWGSKSALTSYIDQRIGRGFMTGESKKTMIDDMAARFGTDAKSAGRLIMTESAYYSAVATQKAYKDQGVKKFEFMATLDEKTCDLCGPLDGKQFDMRDYEPGLNAEPQHAWCRCTTIPVVDPDIWDDSEDDRATRDESGRYMTVPGNITYEEWRKKYAG